MLKKIVFLKNVENNFWRQAQMCVIVNCCLKEVIEVHDNYGEDYT